MTVLMQFPITYTAADGAVVHSPMIGARVGGVETRLVLDTGSDVHLITRELADEVGIEGTPGEEGTDHAGATMASWDVGTVDMRVGATDLLLRDTVAIPAPPPFPRWGVGGIMSPQHLHPTGTIVIDLSKDELLVVDDAVDAVLQFLIDRCPIDTATLVLERDRSFPSLVVPAAIEPYEEIAVMLNTGGKSTEFLADVVSGVARGPIARTGGGVSGADVRGADGGRQRLRVGGWYIPVPRLNVRDSMLEPHGLVGMDVLRGTTIACAADTGRPVIWQVPGATRDRSAHAGA
jgi:hypothetical protein